MTVSRPDDPLPTDNRQLATELVFDCFSGVAGDMTIAALVSCGASLEAIVSGLRRLPLPGFELATTEVTRGGLRALHLEVTLSEERTYQPDEMREMVRTAQFPERVEQRALAAIGWLERGEAGAHGTNRPHLHEAGGVDAVIDLVGAMLALEDLGIERAFCPVVTVGAGTIARTSHGPIPAAPGPAAAHILQEAGFALRFVDASHELVTPTGAAILAAVATPGPATITPVAHGAGAGTFDPPGRPNALRVFVGRREEGGGRSAAGPGSVALTPGPSPAAAGEGGTAAGDSGLPQHSALSTQHSVAALTPGPSPAAAGEGGVDLADAGLPQHLALSTQHSVAALTPGPSPAAAGEGGADLADSRVGILGTRDSGLPQHSALSTQHSVAALTPGPSPDPAGERGADLADSGLPQHSVVLLETNIDDMTGELLAHARDRLLAEGALDAWLETIAMKKGRPAAKLCALCRPDDEGRLAGVFFAETSTLGVRVAPYRRYEALRRVETRATEFGDVRFKVRTVGESERAEPEWEDVRAISEREGIPAIDVARRIASGRPSGI